MTPQDDLTAERAAMTLQAGHELDALIAEKVMGFKLGDEPVGDEIHEVYRSPNGRGYYHYQIPRYSTSIEAAWGVVEKITTDFTGVSSKGFGIGFKMEYRTESAGPNYQVTLVETSCAPPFEEMRDICTVVASTAPLAICLAALKVVGA